ncbi:MAG: hypothetical protein JWN24_2111 [Phycisphaerales bacterium]|nr:hypothetical protein [Phycisphaerales bacterium]
MAATAGFITAEELWAMPGGEHRELVRGELRATAPSGVDHGAVAINLSELVTSHVKQYKLGQVVMKSGFILARNPDVVRGPDVAFVQVSRIPAAERPIRLMVRMSCPAFSAAYAKHFCSGHSTAMIPDDG